MTDKFLKDFNTHYGEIIERGNLIEIYTGGCSDNEEVIRELSRTIWWRKYLRATRTGGHYYFNTDLDAEGDWIVRAEDRKVSSEKNKKRNP